MLTRVLRHRICRPLFVYLYVIIMWYLIKTVGKLTGHQVHVFWNRELEREEMFPGSFVNPVAVSMLCVLVSPCLVDI